MRIAGSWAALVVVCNVYASSPSSSLSFRCLAVSIFIQSTFFHVPYWWCVSLWFGCVSWWHLSENCIAIMCVCGFIGRILVSECRRFSSVFTWHTVVIRREFCSRWRCSQLVCRVGVKILVFCTFEQAFIYPCPTRRRPGQSLTLFACWLNASIGSCRLAYCLFFYNVVEVPIFALRVG